MATVVFKAGIDRIELRDYPGPVSLTELDHYYANLLELMEAAIWERVSGPDWASGDIDINTVHPLPPQPLFSDDGVDNTMRFCCNFETFDDGFKLL
jgi:hypothetical protein